MLPQAKTTSFILLLAVMYWYNSHTIGFIFKCQNGQHLFSALARRNRCTHGNYASKLLRGQNHMLSLPASSPATLFISALATLHSLRRGSWRHAISLRTNITNLITDPEHALSSHVVAQSKALAQIGRRSLPTPYLPSIMEECSFGSLYWLLVAFHQTMCS